MVDMNIAEAAYNFYSDHYKISKCWILEPGKVIILGDKDRKFCRFCGLSSPRATFRKRAHAIPEATGNKSLYTHYECDACNILFGTGIENDFGNWTKPMRTISRIIGKNGVPTIERKNDGYRIQSGASGLEIYQNAIGQFVEIDDVNKIIRLKLPRDAYTPVAVLKTFFKMGLSLLSETEIENYRNALDWIRCSDHTNVLINKCNIFHTSYRWHPGNGRIRLILLRKIKENDNLPCVFFIVNYGNEQFQIPLLSLELDHHLNNISFEILPWPYPDQWISMPGFVTTKLLDLTGRELVTGDNMTITISYETKTR
jgi:hypothetical protein